MLFRSPREHSENLIAFEPSGRPRPRPRTPHAQKAMTVRRSALLGCAVLMLAWLACPWPAAAQHGQAEHRRPTDIKQYLVQRYGDFVLYRPAFKPTTYLLWLGPFVLLVLGLVMLWRVLRQRRPQNAATELSAQERERVQSLLKDGA